jgi:hypothetical protein
MLDTGCSILDVRQVPGFVLICAICGQNPISIFPAFKFYFHHSVFYYVFQAILPPLTRLGGVIFQYSTILSPLTRLGGFHPSTFPPFNFSIAELAN